MSNEKHAEILNLRDALQYQEGSVVSRSLLGSKAGNVTFFAFAEGEGLSEHSAPFDALVLILAGSASIFIAKQEFKMQEQDSIILPANVPHAVHAASNFKMLLVMIKAPN